MSAVTTASGLFEDAPVGSATALLASTCTSCRRTEFPRRPDCPACGAEVRPTTLAGPATTRVSTAVLAQPPGSLVRAPYSVGVAEFPEGVCVIGLLVDDPEVGDRVEVVVHEPYDDGRVFAFRRLS